LKGLVFDIQEFMLHDGPGIRVAVFLKGCPLRCKWCHNPEGLSPEPQLLVRKKECTNCGLCRQACEHEECRPFDLCTKICPKNLIRISGREYEAKDLAKHLRKYQSFLEQNEGGITISGGEPLMQADFTMALIEHLKPMHTVIETSGYAPEDVFRSAADAADLIMLDIKHSDSQLHKQATGVGNELILKNLATLKKGKTPFIIRVPVIPGFNDTEENLKKTAELAEGASIELLPYNRMAGAKYPLLGLEFQNI